MDPNFATVCSYLLSHPEVARGGGARGRDLVRLGELWGPLPADFHSFLTEFGWVAVEGLDVLGLGEGVPRELDLIARARGLWRGVPGERLPRTLLPVGIAPPRSVFAFDRSLRGHPVVRWAPAGASGDPAGEAIFASWSQWFLRFAVGAPE